MLGQLSAGVTRSRRRGCGPAAGASFGTGWNWHLVSPATAGQPSQRHSVITPRQWRWKQRIRGNLGTQLHRKKAPPGPRACGRTPGSRMASSHDRIFRTETRQDTAFAFGTGSRRRWLTRFNSRRADWRVGVRRGNSMPQLSTYPPLQLCSSSREYNCVTFGGKTSFHRVRIVQLCRVHVYLLRTFGVIDLTTHGDQLCW